MSKYNFFQAIPLSFFSGKLYRDVARNWGGNAFLYLFFLLALTCIAFTYRAQVGLTAVYSQISEKIVPQIPVLTLDKGKLSTPEKRPYTITAPDSKELIAVIDTSGQYTSVEQANAPILITEDSIITQKKDEVSIRKVPDFTGVIEPHVVDTAIKKYIGYGWIFIYVLVLFGAYIFRVLQALLYALVGRIIAAIFRVDLTYGQVLQLALVTITPTIIVTTLVYLFGFMLPHSSLIYVALAMIYLVYAVLVNKKSST